MTIIEHAIQDIDRRIHEALARIDDDHRAVLFLRQEKQKILDEAAREGLRAALRAEATRDGRH